MGGGSMGGSMGGGMNGGRGGGGGMPDGLQQGGEQLPPGWSTAQDTDGSVYFWHVESGQTSWQHPSQMGRDGGGVHRRSRSRSPGRGRGNSGGIGGGGGDGRRRSRSRERQPPSLSDGWNPGSGTPRGTFGGGGGGGLGFDDPDRRCVFITNIDSAITKGALINHMSRWGNVDLVKIRENPRRHADKKFAFVTFRTVDNCLSAISLEAQRAHKECLGGGDVFAKQFERRGAHNNTHDNDSRGGVSRFARNDNRY